MKKIIKSSMVSVALLGGMVSAVSADVTIPNTFTAGEAAKASEVNENFTALKNAVNTNAKKMPGIATETLTSASLDSSYADRLSITIEAPANGFVHIIATGRIRFLNKVDGSWAAVNVGVTNAADSAPDTMDYTRYYLDKGISASLVPYTAQGVFSVTEGSHTFYLTGREENGIAGSIMNNRLTAIFYPSEI